jgi:hypothetical protein
MEAGLPEQIKKGGFNGACLWAYKQVNDYHFDYKVHSTHMEFGEQLTQFFLLYKKSLLTICN